MKVGHDFKLSKEFQKDTTVFNIGGYKVISHLDFGVMIQGSQLLNLFDLKISIVGILPLNEEMQKVIEDYPFEIEKHHLVYQVSFNDHAWYFNDRQDAFAILDLILQVKESALRDKFTKGSSVDVTVETKDCV